MIIRNIADRPRRRVIGRSLLVELFHPGKIPEVRGLRCSVAHAIVPPGESTLPHLLKTSTELSCILEGSGEMHIGSQTAPVYPGRSSSSRPGSTSISGIPWRETSSSSASFPRSGRQMTRCWHNLGS